MRPEEDDEFHSQHGVQLVEGNSRHAEISPDEGEALRVEITEPGTFWGLPWMVRHRDADDRPPQHCGRLLEAHEYGSRRAVLGPLGGISH